MRTESIRSDCGDVYAHFVGTRLARERVDARTICAYLNEKNDTVAVAAMSNSLDMICIQ